MFRQRGDRNVFEFMHDDLPDKLESLEVSEPSKLPLYKNGDSSDDSFESCRTDVSSNGIVPREEDGISCPSDSSDELYRDVSSDSVIHVSSFKKGVDVASHNAVDDGLDDVIYIDTTYLKISENEKPKITKIDPASPVESGFGLAERSIGSTESNSGPLGTFIVSGDTCRANVSSNGIVSKEEDGISCSCDSSDELYCDMSLNSVIHVSSFEKGIDVASHNAVDHNLDEVIYIGTTYGKNSENERPKITENDMSNCTESSYSLEESSVGLTESNGGSSGTIIGSMNNSTFSANSSTTLSAASSILFTESSTVSADSSISSFDRSIISTENIIGSPESSINNSCELRVTRSRSLSCSLRSPERPKARVASQSFESGAVADAEVTVTAKKSRRRGRPKKVVTSFSEEELMSDPGTYRSGQEASESESLIPQFETLYFSKQDGSPKGAQTKKALPKAAKGSGPRCVTNKSRNSTHVKSKGQKKTSQTVVEESSAESCIELTAPVTCLAKKQSSLMSASPKVATFFSSHSASASSMIKVVPPQKKVLTSKVKATGPKEKIASLRTGNASSKTKDTLPDTKDSETSQSKARGAYVSTKVSHLKTGTVSKKDSCSKTSDNSSNNSFKKSKGTALPKPKGTSAKTSHTSKNVQGASCSKNISPKNNASLSPVKKAGPRMKSTLGKPGSSPTNKSSTTRNAKPKIIVSSLRTKRDSPNTRRTSVSRTPLRPLRPGKKKCACECVVVKESCAVLAKIKRAVKLSPGLQKKSQEMQKQRSLTANEHARKVPKKLSNQSVSETEASVRRKKKLLAVGETVAKISQRKTLPSLSKSEPATNVSKSKKVQSPPKDVSAVKKSKPAVVIEKLASPSAAKSGVDLSKTKKSSSPKNNSAGKESRPQVTGKLVQSTSFTRNKAAAGYSTPLSGARKSVKVNSNTFQAAKKSIENAKKTMASKTPSNNAKKKTDSKGRTASSNVQRSSPPSSEKDKPPKPDRSKRPGASRAKGQIGESRMVSGVTFRLMSGSSVPTHKLEKTLPKCIYCDHDRFPKKSDLQRHLETEHKFRCSRCKTTLRSKFEKEQHLIGHVKEFHTCVPCDETYRTTWGIHRHWSSRRHQRIEGAFKMVVGILSPLVPGAQDAAADENETPCQLLWKSQSGQHKQNEDIEIVQDEIPNRDIQEAPNEILTLDMQAPESWRGGEGALDFLGRERQLLKHMDRCGLNRLLEDHENHCYYHSPTLIRLKSIIGQKIKEQTQASPISGVDQPSSTSLNANCTPQTQISNENAADSNLTLEEILKSIREAGEREGWLQNDGAVPSTSSGLPGSCSPPPNARGENRSSDPFNLPMTFINEFLSSGTAQAISGADADPGPSTSTNNLLSMPLDFDYFDLIDDFNRDQNSSNKGSTDEESVIPGNTVICSVSNSGVESTDACNEDMTDELTNGGLDDAIESQIVGNSKVADKSQENQIQNSETESRNEDIPDVEVRPRSKDCRHVAVESDGIGEMSSEGEALRNAVDTETVDSYVVNGVDGSNGFCTADVFGESLRVVESGTAGLQNVNSLMNVAEPASHESEAVPEGDVEELRKSTSTVSPLVNILAEPLCIEASREKNLVEENSANRDLSSTPTDDTEKSPSVQSEDNDKLCIVEDVPQDKSIMLLDLPDDKSIISEDLPDDKWIMSQDLPDDKSIMSDDTDLYTLSDGWDDSGDESDTLSGWEDAESPLDEDVTEKGGFISEERRSLPQLELPSSVESPGSTKMSSGVGGYKNIHTIGSMFEIVLPSDAVNVTTICSIGGANYASTNWSTEVGPNNPTTNDNTAGGPTSSSTLSQSQAVGKIYPQTTAYDTTGAIGQNVIDNSRDVTALMSAVILKNTTPVATTAKTSTSSFVQCMTSPSSAGSAVSCHRSDKDSTTCVSGKGANVETTTASDNTGAIVWNVLKKAQDVATVMPCVVSRNSPPVATTATSSMSALRQCVTSSSSPISAFLRRSGNNDNTTDVTGRDTKVDDMRSPVTRDFRSSGDTLDHAYTSAKRPMVTDVPCTPTNSTCKVSMTSAALDSNVLNGLNVHKSVVLSKTGTETKLYSMPDTQGTMPSRVLSACADEVKTSGASFHKKLGNELKETNIVSRAISSVKAKCSDSTSSCCATASSNVSKDQIGARNTANPAIGEGVTGRTDFITQVKAIIAKSRVEAPKGDDSNESSSDEECSSDATASSSGVPGRLATSRNIGVDQVGVTNNTNPTACEETTGRISFISKVKAIMAKSRTEVCDDDGKSDEEHGDSNEQCVLLSPDEGFGDTDHDDFGIMSDGEFEKFRHSMEDFWNESSMSMHYLHSLKNSPESASPSYEEKEVTSLLHSNKMCSTPARKYLELKQVTAMQRLASELHEDDLFRQGSRSISPIRSLNEDPLNVTTDDEDIMMENEEKENVCLGLKERYKSLVDNRIKENGGFRDCRRQEWGDLKENSNLVPRDAPLDLVVPKIPLEPVNQSSELEDGSSFANVDIEGSYQDEAAQQKLSAGDKMCQYQKNKDDDLAAVSHESKRQKENGTSEDDAIHPHSECSDDSEVMNNKKLANETECTDKKKEIGDRQAPLESRTQEQGSITTVTTKPGVGKLTEGKRRQLPYTTQEKQQLCKKPRLDARPSPVAVSNLQVRPPGPNGNYCAPALTFGGPWPRNNFTGLSAPWDGTHMRRTLLPDPVRQRVPCLMDVLQPSNQAPYHQGYNYWDSAPDVHNPAFLPYGIDYVPGDRCLPPPRKILRSKAHEVPWLNHPCQRQPWYTPAGVHHPSLVRPLRPVRNPHPCQETKPPWLFPPFQGYGGFFNGH